MSDKRTSINSKRLTVGTRVTPYFSKLTCQGEVRSTPDKDGCVRVLWDGHQTEKRVYLRDLDKAPTGQPCPECGEVGK